MSELQTGGLSWLTLNIIRQYWQQGFSARATAVAWAKLHTQIMSWIFAVYGHTYVIHDLLPEINSANCMHN